MGLKRLRSWISLLMLVRAGRHFTLTREALAQADC
ncbi:hypothetical protein FHX59_000484 [Paraburkholderia silvatlantica]|uniref:HTH lysR-type domain-containing protein n=1 Tax=Paraburkholderia silvatlantica TaxID=321895 RepID=A0ABR6FF85_9BURK|nr:hypothetical protein [Paraburkholderia silvatlantica]PVY23460.1 hypothetical protein C7411_12997 [Paraburkholderia silvatlantica]PXW30499.1 hypothetical protein C7413_12897 [Paraburkholderia silvatlantica]